MFELIVLSRMGSNEAVGTAASAPLRFVLCLGHTGWISS
jgi:hypothetical protein